MKSLVTLLLTTLMAAHASIGCWTIHERAEPCHGHPSDHGHAHHADHHSQGGEHHEHGCQHDDPCVFVNQQAYSANLDLAIAAGPLFVEILSDLELEGSVNSARFLALDEIARSGPPLYVWQCALVI